MLFRIKNLAIFELEKQRAWKAGWHQIAILIQETQSGTVRLVDRDDPVTDAVLNTLPSSIIVYPPPPTLTIPYHLRLTFPFPFQPNRDINCGECCSNDCPVSGLHLAGLYYHDFHQLNAQGPQSEWFGDCEAPPELWHAVMRLMAGDGAGDETLARDVEMVREFRRCHYYTFREQGGMDYRQIVRQASTAYDEALELCETQKRGDQFADADADAGTSAANRPHVLGALIAASTEVAAIGFARATTIGAANAATTTGAGFANATNTSISTATYGGAGAADAVDAATVADSVADSIAGAVADIIIDTVPADIADAVADRVADALVNVITEVTESVRNSVISGDSVASGPVNAVVASSHEDWIWDFD